MKEKLTSKQKKFALEFLISGNITDAAKKAGYSDYVEKVWERFWKGKQAV